jgi:hypothetical protein
MKIMRWKRKRACGEFQELSGSGNVRSSGALKRRSALRSNRISGRRSGRAGSPTRRPKPIHRAVGLSANRRLRPNARSTKVGQSSLKYGRVWILFKKSIASLTVRSSIFRKAVAGTVTSHPPRFRARNTSKGVQFSPSTNAFQGVPKSCSTTNSRPPWMLTCKPTCMAMGGPNVDCRNPANRRSNICTGRINQAPITLRLSL